MYSTSIRSLIPTISISLRSWAARNAKRPIRPKPLIPTLILVWLLIQGLSLLVVNEGRYRKPLEGLLITQTLLFWDLAKRRRFADANLKQ